MSNRENAKDELRNPHLVTIAAYLEGGQHRAVDSEDIAVRVFEIAPNRFGWRKYKDHIDIFAVRSALSDARKRDHGELLTGSDRAGWQLTLQGLAFVKENLGRLEGFETRSVRQTPEERRRQVRERQRLLGEPAWQKFNEDRIDEVTPTEAERFFRLDDYVVGPARRRRIDRLLVMFASDPELGPASHAIAEVVPHRGGD